MRESCIVNDCEKPRHSKGYCSTHAARVRRNGDPELLIRLRGASLEDRLWHRTVVVGDCWVYDAPGGPVKRDGSRYASIKVDGAMTGVHLAAYREFVGPVPEGAQIHHICETKPCWRPDHLKALTSREHWLLHHPERPTHCPKGHEYAEENTYEYVDDRGWVHRSCRTCNRAAKRRHKERRRRA